MAEKQIVIGKVGAPHGINGEVRVQLLTDFPNRFDKLKKVYAGEKLLSIASVRHQGEKLLLKFDDFNTREEVRALNGIFLSVPRSEAMPLTEGEYYTFDILGLKVVDTENHFLGEVVNILFTGSNDVYVVKNKETAKEILIPALKKVVQSIDLENRLLRVLPLEMFE